MPTPLKWLVSVLIVLLAAEGGLRICKKLGASLILRPPLTMMRILSAEEMQTPMIPNIIAPAAARQNLGALYQEDELLFWTLRPNLSIEATNFLLPASAWDKGRYPVQTHALGFRTPTFRPAKDKGVQRILCIGDSRTFGWGVREEHSYPYLLRDKLSRESSPVEVISLGVPGYTSYQGLQLLTRTALSWQPDVVICWFGNNDRIPGPLSDRERSATRRWRYRAGTALCSHSLLASVAFERGFFLTLRLRASSKKSAPVAGAKVRVDLKEVEKNYSDMAEACRKAGVKFLVISDLLQDHAEASDRVAAHHGFPSLPLRSLLTLEMAQKAMGDPRNKQHVQEWCDLFGESAPDPPTRIFFVDGSHLSWLGSELLASEVASVLMPGL